jgi:hypothetical protein
VSKKEIEKRPSRPTGLYVCLGLIPSQTRIRKSALELQINHNKQYKKIKGAGEKGKKGGKRRLRIVTPLHR